MVGQAVSVTFLNTGMCRCHLDIDCLRDHRSQCHTSDRKLQHSYQQEMQQVCVKQLAEVARPKYASNSLIVSDRPGSKCWLFKDACSSTWYEVSCCWMYFTAVLHLHVSTILDGVQCVLTAFVGRAEMTFCQLRSYSFSLAYLWQTFTQDC